MKITNKGFTFVELLMTVSILGVLAVAAIPKDYGDALMSAEAASRKIMGDLRYAQSLAMTTSVSHGVRGTSANTYEVYNFVTNAPVKSPFHQTPMQEDLSDVFNRTQFTNFNFDIRFDSSGRPTVGGGTSIQLNNTGQVKNIQITASSGHISVL